MKAIFKSKKFSTQQVLSLSLGSFCGSFYRNLWFSVFYYHKPNDAFLLLLRNTSRSSRKKKNKWNINTELLKLMKQSDDNYDAS